MTFTYLTVFIFIYLFIDQYLSLSLQHSLSHSLFLSPIPIVFLTSFSSLSVVDLISIDRLVVIDTSHSSFIERKMTHGYSAALNIFALIGIDAHTINY